MAKEKKRIGTIMKCGPDYHSIPNGQPGQVFRTHGEAHAYFRRFVGQESPVGPGQLVAQVKAVSFEGDFNRDRQEGVYLTANWTPAPAPPPPGPVIPTGLPPFADTVRLALDFATPNSLYSDSAGTVLAADGERVRVWRDWRPGAEDIVGYNDVSDAASPYARSDGVSFGEAATNSHLKTDIAQSSPYTVYATCERGTTSCLVFCDGNNEGYTWLNSTASLIVAQEGHYSTGYADGIAGSAVRGGVFDGPNSYAFNEVGGANQTSPTPISWRLRMGCINTSFRYTGKWKQAIVFDGAHDAAKRAETIAFLQASSTTPPVRQSVPTGTQIDVVIPVHYEGGSNLGPSSTDGLALLALRAAHPQFKLTHGFSPSYYTAVGATPGTINAAYAQQAMAGDELAMHIHPWSQFVIAAGVTYLNTPIFSSGVAASVSNGYDVLLTAYSKADFQTITTFGLDTLQTQLGTRPVSFIAGGWLLDADRLEALANAGITHDASVIPTAFSDKIPSASYLIPLLRTQYAGTREDTQPFAQSTPGGNVMRLPASSAAADYFTDNTVYEVYLRAVQKAIATGQKQVVTLSCHFLATSANRLKAQLDRIVAHAALHGITLNSKTVSQITA